MTKFFPCTAAALGAALVLFPTGEPRFGLFAQASHEHATPAVNESQPAASTTRHETMMAEMKAADARLEGLVNAMNAATRDEKVAAIVQVVNELVRQQKTAHEHMATMGQGMMAGRGGRMGGRQN